MLEVDKRQMNGHLESFNGNETHGGRGLFDQLSDDVDGFLGTFQTLILIAILHQILKTRIYVSKFQTSKPKSLTARVT